MKTLRSCLLSFLISVFWIIGIVVAIILGVFFYNWIVTDQTATVMTDAWCLRWDQTLYKKTWGIYKEGRFIAKASNGGRIFAVAGDPDRNFIVLKDFDSSGFLSGGVQLMMREDHQMTTNEVTRVGDSKNSELCRAMQEILTGDSELFSDTLSEYHTGRLVAIYYDHSPVGWHETVAYVQDQYVILDIDDERESDPIDDYNVAVRCKVIDEKYLPILRKHLGGVLDAAVADAKEREEQTSSP